MMATAKYDKPAKAPAATSRARRWLRRAIEIGVVAVAFGWFVQAVLLPWLIRDKVTAALAGLGFADASFEVRSASFWRTRLADLAAAGGDLRVGTLDVSYRPLAAASGELDVIRIGGAEIRLTIRDGKANLGPPPATSQQSATKTPAADASLPFARLEVASSSLRVDWDGREFWLPVSGTVVNRGAGAADVKLDSFAFGSPLAIVGTMDQRHGTSQLTVTAGQLDVAAVLASLPESFGPIPVRAGGRAAVRVDHVRSENGQSVTTATFNPTNVWVTSTAGGREVSVAGLTLQSQAELDETFHVKSASASGRMSAIRIGHEVVGDVGLEIRTEGQSVVFDAAARGDSWHIDRLSGRASGLLGAQGGTDIRLETTLHGGARLPPRVVERLNAAGTDVSGLGEARVQADATGRAARPSQGGWNWDVAVAKLQLTLPDGDLTGPGNSKLTALAGVLNLGGEFNADGGDVFLLDDSWIGFRSLDAGTGDKPTHVGETRLALVRDAERPLASVEFEPKGSRLRVAMTATNDGPLAVNAAGTEANLGRLSVGMNIEGEPGEKPSVTVAFGMTDGQVTHAESGLSLAGISARVPVSFNATTPAAPGAFEVASIAFGKKKFEPLRGTLGVNDSRATFTANWAALPDAVLDVKGWLAPGANGATGEITANVPEFRLEDADALADRIAALEGWAVTGTFAADAKLTIADGRLVPRAALKVAGAGARSADVGIDAKGVAGALTVDSFAPFATPGGQQLSVRELAFGNVKMADASFAFRVEPGAFLIERAGADWLGGRVFTHGVRVAFADPKFETTLYAEDLSLRELLAFAAEGRATGEGVMFGKLPVAIDWPRVRLGQGYLYSRSAAGAIQVLDTQLMAETMERSDPRFVTDPDLVEVKNRVVRALSDFEYDALTFNFDEESGGLVRINIHGRGRAGERPQELDMTLNVRGANDLLNHYLQMKTKWDELSN